jgi:AGZA family xanthine/uracil permease-like MFS transporter
VAGLLGGVIQTTPYIGHPAYKKMGGRAAYTLATALFVGVIGCFGVFGMLHKWLPPVAMFPILVFVGLEITAQSFHATPSKHYAALAIAFLPTLAYLALIPLEKVLAGRPLEDVIPGFLLPRDKLGLQVFVQTLRCLANGFIVTSLLWAAALSALLDGRLWRSAVYLCVAGGLSLFGVIHSPLPGSPIGWPGEMYRQMMPRDPAILCQSPYHWAAAYALSAAVLVGLSFFRGEEKTELV